MKKTLLILGHPVKDSFCGALADAYQGSAVAAGAEFERLDLSDLSFDPILRDGYKSVQELEPDLERSQELIKWAEHLVFVYPTWWATMPALLKGFIDRVFVPGFAFNYQEKSPWPIRHLAGRSGRIVTTMDAPLFYNWIAYRAAGHNAMKRATLQFCGIKPVGITAFGSVKDSSDEKREKWKQQVRALGSETH